MKEKDIIIKFTQKHKKLIDDLNSSCKDDKLFMAIMIECATTSLISVSQMMEEDSANSFFEKHAKDLKIRSKKMRAYIKSIN